MYEPPKSDLNKYKEADNACPKCFAEITVWDYLKPGVRKANSIKCKKCQSILRYNLNQFESLCFILLGMMVAFIPAYFLWPPNNITKFVSYYLPIVIPLWIAIGPLESWFVRRFKKVTLVKEGASN